MSQPPVFNELDFSYLEALVGDARMAILEIGANDGTDTNILAEAFPNATIYAFEPDPRAIAKFKKNVTNERVRLFECAIGAENGSATFHMSSGMPDIPPDKLAEAPADYKEDWDKSGSLKVPKKHLEAWPWVKFDQQLTVPLMTLDTFFQQQSLRGIDLIWADTQGAEADVIKGGAHALSQTRYIYTEYGSEEFYEGQASLEQLLEMLPDYKVLQRYSVDVLLENQVLKNSKQPKGFAHWLRKRLFS